MIVFRADLYFANVYNNFFWHKIFELCLPIATKFSTVIGSVFDFIMFIQN